MKRSLLFLLGCLLVLVGCQTSPYPDYVHEAWAVRCRPRVVLVPMNEACNFNLCWNVGEELTDRILEEFITDSNLIITPLGQVEGGIARLPEHATYSTDLSFAKNFCPSDFLVLMELSEHEFVPYSSGEEIQCQYKIRGQICMEVLKMSVRLRIIDLRGECPRLVMQEIFESNQMIPKNYSGIDYNVVHCGQDAYHNTFLACAHQRLASDLAQRIEAIILCQR